MGRKKIGVVCQAQESFEALLKPFCYYCDKEFDSVKNLITHQRTTHFNCAECGLKFDTVTGLRVHMLNAHKKPMKDVPKAMPGRENPDIVVHGMEGLPKSLVEERVRKAKAEKAEKDKQKEEENRERLKRVAEARGSEEPPAAPEPKRHHAAASSSSAFRAAAAVPPSAAEEPLPPRQAALRQEAPVAPPMLPMRPAQPTQPMPPMAMGSQGMPGLSPSVAKLLSGAEGLRLGPPTVPGLLHHSVPPALNGLHPVALQVLAFVGSLPHKDAGAQPALALLASALGGSGALPPMVTVGSGGL